MPAKDLKIWRKCAAHNEADLRREWLAEAGRSCSKLILSWFVCLKKFHFIIRRFDRNVACEISARLLLWLWGERLDLYFWSRSVLHKNELIQELLLVSELSLQKPWFVRSQCPWPLKSWLQVEICSKFKRNHVCVNGMDMKSQFLQGLKKFPQGVPKILSYQEILLRCTRLRWRKWRRPHKAWQ